MRHNILKDSKEALFNFLKATEKYTGIDNVYFFKGGFWMMVAQILFILSGIALSVAFIHLGGKALYGSYQLVLGVVATLLVTSIPGANTALMQSVSRGHEKTVFTILKQRINWSLLGAFGLLVTAGYFYFLREDLQFGIAFLIAALSFPLSSLTSTFNSFFVGRGDFLHANSYLVAERLVMTVAVILALFINPNFIIIILVYYLAIMLVNALSYFQFKRSYSLKGGEDKGALHYGFDLTWMNIIPKTLLQADKLIIPAILGVESLAVYVIALIIPDTVEGFMNLIQTMAFKKLVHLPKQQIIPKLRQWWMILLFAFIVAATLIGIPYAINIFYGADYAQSIQLAQLYVFILPVNFVWKIFISWLLSQKKTKEYFYFMNGFYIMNTLAIAGMVWFARSLEGVVLSRIAVVVLFAILSLIYLKRSDGISQKPSSNV